MTACLQEALRLYPPGNLIPRYAEREVPAQRVRVFRRFHSNSNEREALQYMLDASAQDSGTDTSEIVYPRIQSCN